MYSLVFLMVGVGTFGSPPQYPYPPQAPAVTTDIPTYSAMYFKSVTTGLPLVVGVGCKPPEGDGWLTCRVETLKGFLGPCVAIARPGADGNLYNVVTLPSNADGRMVVNHLWPIKSQTLTTATYPPQPTYQPAYYHSFQGASSGYGYGGLRCIGST